MYTRFKNFVRATLMKEQQQKTNVGLPLDVTVLFACWIALGSDITPYIGGYLSEVIATGVLVFTLMTIMAVAVVHDLVRENDFREVFKEKSKWQYVSWLSFLNHPIVRYPRNAITLFCVFFASYIIFAALFVVTLLQIGLFWRIKKLDEMNTVVEVK